MQEVQPSRSYLPAWISKPLQRSRLPSYESEIGSSALPSPNLDNTIHGSLHGGNSFADKRWQTSAQAAQPARREPAPPSLRVLGSSHSWNGRQVGPLPRNLPSPLCDPHSTPSTAIFQLCYVSLSLHTLHAIPIFFILQHLGWRKSAKQGSIGGRQLIDGDLKVTASEQLFCAGGERSA